MGGKGRISAERMAQGAKGRAQRAKSRAEGAKSKGHKNRMIRMAPSALDDSDDSDDSGEGQRDGGTERLRDEEMEGRRAEDRRRGNLGKIHTRGRRFIPLQGLRCF